MSAGSQECQANVRTHRDAAGKSPSSVSRPSFHRPLGPAEAAGACFPPALQALSWAVALEGRAPQDGDAQALLGRVVLFPEAHRKVG